MTPYDSLFDEKSLNQLRNIDPLAPHEIRLFRNRLFKKFLPDKEAIADLPWKTSITLHSLELISRADSLSDGATKLLWRTSDDRRLESVILRIASGRTTLCVSSQVGCAAACSFCATGHMGLLRNLTASEILDQVVQAGQLLRAEGRSLRNIVFMGMGEPLHNEQELYQALSCLVDKAFFNFSPKRLMVSTVGIPKGMLRLAAKFPEVRIALSLHSVDARTREQLIPIAKYHGLRELRETIAEIQRHSPVQIMLEYLMIRGVNDSEQQARDLADWIADLRCHINLIPYNPIEEAPHLTATSREVCQEFSQILKGRGYKTTIRYSLGQDIAAACGQLVRRHSKANSSAIASNTTSVK